MDDFAEFIDKLVKNIVSDEEAEEADAVVCAPLADSPFEDNVHTECAECGCQIMHRPHAPKKPKKICMECAIEQSSNTRH